MTASRIIVVQGFGACTEALSALAQEQKVFCLIDPAVSEHLILPAAFSTFMAPQGELAKNLSTANQIWSELQSQEFNRSDLLVTIGGGAMSDLGGFIASTYKRGMRLVHIPTTILGAVDAAIGGKTGIDYGGVKNLIGTFYPAEAVIIVAEEFFHTLAHTEVMSGWGEVLKYSLLSTSCALSTEDYKRLERGEAPTPDCIRRCMDYKIDITSEDLEDKGSRQFLNFGHTMGHALEALMIENSTPVPHGCAVAAGMVIELYLSLMKVGFPQSELMSFARMIKENFTPIRYNCKQYDELRKLARQDKKNITSEIRSVLLTAVGQPILPEPVTCEEIDEAMDFYRDFMGV